jgi:hypothetical protein
MNISADAMKRLRGQILELVSENHQAQRTRLELITLWGVLVRLGFDVGRDDVITLLQDLREREYLRFDSAKDKWSNRVEISKIEITPAGRDLLEGTSVDKAVLLK